jgi:hypothetical protein
MFQMQLIAQNLSGFSLKFPLFSIEENTNSEDSNNYTIEWSSIKC